MRRIDHFTVHLQHPCAGVGSEGIYNCLRMRKLWQTRQQGKRDTGNTADNTFY